MNRPIVCSILVYITVYWWCITRPSYSHYETYIYTHNLWTGTLFEASLRPKWKSSSVVPSRPLRRLSCCWVSADVPAHPRFERLRDKRIKELEEVGMGTMGTGNGAWVWVIPCYTMLYLVIPCYTPNKSRVAIPSYCTMLPLQHCWMLGSIQIVGITHIIIILVNHQLFIYTILITNQQSE